MVLSEVKAWFLTNLVMILGAVLALIGLYVAWLHLITIPRLESRVSIAEAHELEARANVQTCKVANQSLDASLQRQSESLRALVSLAETNQAQLSPILKQLGLIGKDVRTQLTTFTPNPKKTDCENAKTELGLFKTERAGR